jgi:hypothetical protein
LEVALLAPEVGYEILSSVLNAVEERISSFLQALLINGKASYEESDLENENSNDSNGCINAERLEPRQKLFKNLHIKYSISLLICTFVFESG